MPQHAAESPNFDTVAAFDDVVVALGPPQADTATTTRTVDVYRFDNKSPAKVYEHAMVTDPPYSGDPTIAPKPPAPSSNAGSTRSSTATTPAPSNPS